MPFFQLFICDALCHARAHFFNLSNLPSLFHLLTFSRPYSYYCLTGAILSTLN